MGNLHDRIRKLRELADKSQNDAAETLGVNQSHYSKLETGKLDITAKQLTSLASYFDMRIEDFFSNEPIVFNLKNNNNASGVVIHNHLPKSEKNLYENYIKSLKQEIESHKSTIEKLLNQK